jgi:hypothetical protein
MEPVLSTDIWPAIPVSQPEIRGDILEECHRAWDSLRDFRTRRIRSRDYFRGKPRETFTDPDTGNAVDEDTYIQNQGRIPYKMNHIRDVVMNLKGQFRMNKTQRMAYGRNREDNEAAEMMTEGLRYVCDINETDEIDVDQFTESLVSGLYGYKIDYQWMSSRNTDEVKIDPVDPVRIFFTPGIQDRRMEDVDLIGEVLDLSFDEVVKWFAKNPAETARLKYYYTVSAEKAWTYPISGFTLKDNMSFYLASDPSKCRVIVAWKKEYDWQTFLHDPRFGTYELSDLTEAEVKELNALRWAEAQMLGTEPELVQLDTRYEALWKCYFLTPHGQVLYKGTTPYWHELHPYVLGFAGFYDGEIWGLIEDIIDPQRLVNRITSAIDYMFASSAKGVLMIDEDMVPKGMSIQEFASEWTKFNGVIRFKWKPGAPKPEQITHHAVPEGLFRWLASQQLNIREISGVNGAVQGAEPNSGTPASLYQAQIMQAQTTNRDYFDSFFAVRRKRDLMACRLIAQYWQDNRRLPVAGRRPDGTRSLAFDPARVRDIDWDIVMTDTPQSAAARQQMEEFMIELLKSNRLTFRQYLQVSSHPKADTILALIEKTNPLLSEQQLGPEQMATIQMQVQQAAQAGDPNAIAYLQQAQ